MSNKTVLKGQAAFITGASSGIGASVAKQLAAMGCRLILAARRIVELEQLATELRAEYKREVYCAQLDVSDQVAIDLVIANLPDDFKQVDILINNAGLALDLTPLQLGECADWDTMLDVNVKGLLYMTRALLPGMIARNRGHVVNLGSVAGHVVYPGGAVYCAAKHAVAAITEGLRMDLFGTAIRVSSIDPGMVKTDFSRVRFRGDIARAAAVYDGVEVLQPEDIADAISYVLSCPPHVNISQMLIMPTAQAAATMVKRTI